MKKHQCICKQADSTKMQRYRCRKKGCGVAQQQTGRKPAAEKDDPRAITARYEKSAKGKWRKVKRRRRQWAGKVKAELAKLAVPKVKHLEGTWTPEPVAEELEYDPLPARKRGQLPEDFWEKILERREDFARHRS